MDYDSAGIDHKCKMMVRWDRERSPLEPGAWSAFVWLEPNTVDVSGPYA